MAFVLTSLPEMLKQHAFGYWEHIQRQALKGNEFKLYFPTVKIDFDSSLLPFLELNKCTTLGSLTITSKKKEQTKVLSWGVTAHVKTIKAGQVFLMANSALFTAGKYQGQEIYCSFVVNQETKRPGAVT